MHSLHIWRISCESTFFELSINGFISYLILLTSIFMKVNCPCSISQPFCDRRDPRKTTLTLNLVQRRRAQNRVAQRAFRLRKEETIKEISAKLSEMERELERMEHSNDDLTDQISALLRKIRSLERENEELKARFPSISSAGSTPLSTAFPSGRQSFSKGNDAAAMANGCF